MELVKELKDKLINAINQNQEEKIIIFEKDYINDDLLVGGNGDETIV